MDSMTDSAVDPHAHVFVPARFGFNDTRATPVPHSQAIGTRQQFLPVIDVLGQSGFRAPPDRQLPDAAGRCRYWRRHRSADSFSGSSKNLN